MKHFHGNCKKHSYFEGWYFKHTTKHGLYSFIPGISIDDSGRKMAFIQILTTDGSYNIRYDYADTQICTDKLFIQIGDNEFTEKGIKLKISCDELKCSGELFYTGLTPLSSDIMGPFRFVPFMECNHGIISVNHKVNGFLDFQGKQILFANHTGYIEKDWGTSFPKKYFWLQCNDFDSIELSIMISIAEIPFLGSKFTGCICSVYYNGREYRMATYRRVKIEKLSKSEVVLRQGDYILHIAFQPSAGHVLLAPMKGNMKRRIQEVTLGSARFRFLEKSREIFNVTSTNVSYEWVEPETK